MRRWEADLRPALDARGVEIVTVCQDPPEAIRSARGKHGLRATMLADPDLAVSELYGVKNRNALAAPRDLVRGKPWGPLPVPTTILVDSGGIVRWIDQSVDYQTRSHPERVLGAVRDALG